MRNFVLCCIAFLSIHVELFSQSHTPAAGNRVIAHRGAWKNSNLPQNSLAALRHAIELGCAGSEFDVRLTNDNVLVVVHDPSYNGLSIEGNTYSVLSETLLENGESLPTLQAYLEEGLKDNPSTLLVLEIKPSENGPEKGKVIAEMVWRLVHEMNAQEKVIYISFDFGILQKIRSLDASASLHYLEGNKNPEDVKMEGLSGINYHYSVFQRKPDFIQRAKAQDLKINSWTVNDPSIMDWLIEHDFNFITTDEPEVLLKKYVEKQK